MLARQALIPVRTILRSCLGLKETFASQFSSTSMVSKSKRCRLFVRIDSEALIGHNFANPGRFRLARGIGFGFAQRGPPGQRHSAAAFGDGELDIVADAVTSAVVGKNSTSSTPDLLPEDIIRLL